MERIDAGTSLGHYRILGPIGEGGMGQVWLANDERLDRRVAVKVLPPETSSDYSHMSRFVQEARLASSLNHPNIAHVYDIGHEGEIAYLVMEYVDGESLGTKLRKGPLLPDESAQIGADIADALEAAHARGITHRDIKPGNIVITPEGRAKVLDFGLAKVTNPERSGSDETRILTRVGVILGTAQYMSPEQALGRAIDCRSDIYSLGIVLHEMLTGAIPVAGILPMPDPLDVAVRRCLEMDPANRYQSAAELARDLRAASEAKPAKPQTKAIRTVIVDDEDLARMLVREFLTAHADIEIVAECSNGFEAVKTLTELKPDLVLLDVQMPKLDGFEVLELASAEPAVVFTTAYDQYAMRAFDAHAVDYLLKPFSAERFNTALDRARQRLREQTSPITPAAAAELAVSARAPQQYAERVVVKDGAKVTIIPVDKLDYVDAQDDYVALHSMKRSYLKQQTISSLEAALDPKQFVRIHRSCIVNIERIAKIEPYTKDSRVAILHDTTRLPVSRAGYARLSALLEGKS